MADAADWAAQVDEIQALASIYEEDFKVIEVQGVDLPADGGPVACLAGAAEPSGAWEVRCELAVEVELPAEGGLRVRLDTQPEAAEAEAVEAATAGAAAGELGQADEAPPGGQQRRPPAAAAAAFAVAHLPPIMLRLRLHPGYPSTFPPYASLSALWLSPGRAAELEAQLEAVWEAAGPGGPVLYAWADWLQTAALTHLGAAEMLVIGGVDGGADGADGGDGEAAGEARLLSLLRYSAARELDLFQRATHSCGICMEEQPGARFVRLDCGHHFFCAGCVGAQARVHVADGSLGALKCAHPPCGAPLQAHTLRRVLPTEAYERWEALTLQRALDAMPDAAYCPRCRALALEDPADNCAQCPTCAFVFCSLCAEGRHPGVRCVSAETRLAMLRRKAEGGGAAAVAELRRREHEFLSLAEVERSSKPCPSCGAAIQRSEGCNKMACSRCSAFWCACLARPWATMRTATCNGVAPLFVAACSRFFRTHAVALGYPDGHGRQWAGCARP
jgi:E3 ubiquitin-protein ligase RNF14